jgi:hypothetical protein
MQFSLSALQPRATVGPVSAVAVHSALRRLRTVPCAIEVGYRRGSGRVRFLRGPFDARRYNSRGSFARPHFERTPGRAGRRDARIICPVDYRLQTRETPNPRLCRRQTEQLVAREVRPALQVNRRAF